MTQAILEKINNKISQLQAENMFLRSFVIGVLARDQEEEYQPEFVKKILQLSKKKAEFIFKDTKSFLAQIQKSS